MRVLQLGPYPPPHGGVQANLSALRAALLAHGDTCPVMVITRGAAAGDETEVFRPKSSADLFLSLISLDFGIAHLHIGGGLTNRLLLLVLICAWLPGRRSVLTFHSGGYPSSPAGQRAKPNSLAGFIFRQLDRVIAVNPAIVDMFKRFGVDEDKIRLIPPHAIPQVDDALILPETLQRFLDQHSPVLISVGLLEPEYDLGAQIELMTPIRKEFPGAGLIMIGSGSLESDLRARIEASTEREHILLAGDLDHRFTLRVMTECDLMLRTTIYDGDSISVREALALGLPVVATDNGMRPDGVELVPVSEPASLLNAAVNRLKAGTAKTISIGSSLDNIAAVIELYRELQPARNDR